jgi:hypothetical protein
MSDTPGSGFGKFVPGFEFLQNLAGQAASGVAQGLGNSLPQLPNLGHWVAPTFNVEDLEKRIEELKAVHFWLDQNAKALGATIQALEVQKMTLATLQGMNFSLGDVANALKIKAADTVAGLTGGAVSAPTTFAGLEVPERTYGNSPVVGSPQMPQPSPPPAAPAPKRPARKTQASNKAPLTPVGGVVDPMQWWGALSQQFQHIATNAMKDVAKQTALDGTKNAASGLTSQAVKTASGVAGAVTRGITGTVSRNVGAAAGLGQAAARAVTSRRNAASPPAPAKKAVAMKKKAGAKAAPAQESPAAARRARSASAQPLGKGEWPLPTAFFQVPGFTLGGAADDKPARVSAKKKPATQASKPTVKKAAARKSSRKTASARPKR